MFHVNPTTGEAGACSAKPDNCPFGGLNVHYTSKDAAREAFEKTMAADVLRSNKKKDGRSKRNNWADIDLYRNAVKDEDEVFVHPQGKIAIGHPDGSLTVFRNGKKASTSGSLDDLRAGRGAWEQVKGSGEDLPSNDDYRNAYENTDSPSDSTAGSVAPIAPVEPVSERDKANIAAGYPKGSQLDASKSGIIKQGDELREYKEYRDGGAWNGSSILTVNERVNPHKDFKTSEWLTGWNFTSRAGEKHVATIEVWKGPGGRPGTFNYKLVATSGDHVEKIGSKGGFYADQTGANMGRVWEMCGAFKAEEGGEAIGEIPSRKMPLYTYK